VRTLRLLLPNSQARNIDIDESLAVPGKKPENSIAMDALAGKIAVLTALDLVDLAMSAPL
jgi:hypothetical protein